MISNHSLNRLKVLQYTAIMLMILSSGSGYFYVLHAGITLGSLLTMSILVAFFTEFNTKNNLFSVTYSFLICINVIVYGVNYGLIGDAIFLSSSLLILSSINYNNFRHFFLNIVVFLSIISIILYILFLWGLITPTLQGVGKNGLLGYYVYAFHIFGGGHILGMGNRLCGIFWEPGIYQMVLNICLLLNLELFESKKKKNRIKLWLIILAIILTQSTTGYLVLGMIIIGFYIQKSKHSVKFKLLALCAGTMFYLVIIFSPVISDKFSFENSSFFVRFNDFIGLFQAMFVNPIIGLGIGTEAFEAAQNTFGMTNSLSAGILLQSTQLGILWLFTFYIAAYKEYKKRKIKLPAYIYYGIITALGICEPLAFSGIMLLNVLPMKNYK